MKKGRLYNRQEIELISKSAIGKSIQDIANEELITVDSNGLNKGSLGLLVEKILFGIDNNNDSEPDFMPAGVELKVTPYKVIKGGQLSAKERLVLNTINYETEYKNTFFDSHFLSKNKVIQLIWYLWEPDKESKDLIFTHEKVLELLTSDDIKQIEEDWNTIVDKIKEGKAHEISEADTMYLGACTKGANSNSLRKQPNSDVLAMQRAFCFKTSYMTQLVRKYIGDYNDVESIISDKKLSFIENINSIIRKYIGKTESELRKEFNIEGTAKDDFNRIVNRMFSLKRGLGNTEEFKKANIFPKTIRIEENGIIKESLSFPAFEYIDIINQTWETCEFRDQLETTKIMFFVFKKENGEYVFKGIKLWNMPETDINSAVKNMWEKTVNIIKSGNIVKSVTEGVRKTNFPGVLDNGVCHVRPHANNADDTYPLPVKDKFTGLDKYTKHCFWINRQYIMNVLEDFINE